jgi:AraC-like DNA-binding protein
LIGHLGRDLPPECRIGTLTAQTQFGQIPVKISFSVGMSPRKSSACRQSIVVSGTGSTSSEAAAHIGEQGRESRRITQTTGFWWFHDPIANRTVLLDTLFEKCGWNLTSLSKTLGIGTRTFARITEESLGITGKKWLRRIRIVRAGHLLREGNEIDEVARSLGFHHKSDFSHEFRKLVGPSPSEFVKSEQGRMFRPDLHG